MEYRSLVEARICRERGLMLTGATQPPALVLGKKGAQRPYAPAPEPHGGECGSPEGKALWARPQAAASSRKAQTPQRFACRHGGSRKRRTSPDGQGSPRPDSAAGGLPRASRQNEPANVALTPRVESERPVSPTEAAWNTSHGWVENSPRKAGGQGVAADAPMQLKRSVQRSVRRSP